MQIIRRAFHKSPYDVFTSSLLYISEAKPCYYSHRASSMAAEFHRLLTWDMA